MALPGRPSGRGSRPTRLGPSPRASPLHRPGGDLGGPFIDEQVERAGGERGEVGPDGASRRSGGSRSRSVGTLVPRPASGLSQPKSFPSFHRIAQSVRAAREEPRDAHSYTSVEARRVFLEARLPAIGGTVDAKRNGAACRQLSTGPPCRPVRVPLSLGARRGGYPADRCPRATPPNATPGASHGG